MNEPRRLSEEDNEFEGLLLRAARNYRASEQSHQRALAAVGLGAATNVLTSSAWAGLSLSQKAWALLGTAAVSVAVGVAGYRLLSSSSPLPAAAPKASPALAAQDGADTTQEASNRSQAALAPSASASAERTLSPLPNKRSLPTPEQASPEALGLTAELAALDAASRALSAGNGAGALALLGNYDRAFPKGELRIEASVLRIEALARAGQTAEAASRARRFLKQHPKSALAERVRRFAQQAAKD